MTVLRAKEDDLSKQNGGGNVKRKRDRFDIKKINLSGYCFILPALVIMLMLIVYPLCYGIYISFFDTNLVNKWDIVGLENYQSIGTDIEFYRSIWTTLKFTIFVVAGHFLIGFILAHALNRKIRGMTVFRSILLLPWLFPEAVIALIFKWIFNPVYGLLNHTLLTLGVISEPYSWIGSEEYAFAMLVFVCIWKGYPMVMTMILAGLQNVDKSYYEAARVDGGTKWQEFIYITLPSLKSVLTVTLVLDTVWWFKHYTMAWILTKGGPGTETSLVSIDIYKTAFEFFDFGKAAAMSVFVFVICLIISKLYRRILKDD